MTTQILDCKGVSFSYPGSAPALSNISLQLGKGQFMAIIGPNGSGKSTFLKGILGQLNASGELHVPETRRIGYVPQSTTIDPSFPISAIQVVRLGMLITKPWYKRLTSSDKSRALSALEAVGLADRANLQFGTLSGGQQQRVLLARALATDPALVLLDEPFNGLDQPNRDALLATIHNLKAQGVSVIASTHDLELVEGIADQVAILNRTLIACGDPHEVMTSANLDAAYGAGYYAH
ncbi:MAG: metal ABC transporter ATP-binding protein [Corynebacterium sp.]|nr:metal ABC transporter ATP-binding protein [Corynebacterium sp.]